MGKKFNYNPDILTCMANLSNDEVFTPPVIANKMLDLLPSKIWSDPNITFLDPGCKTGVFLREITKRLLVGLEEIIPDLQERVNHIMTKQVYGIGITELTAMMTRRTIYCSKIANGKYSVCTGFEKPYGNIRFKRTNHTWKNNRCVLCGASKKTNDRGEVLETHAYEFIHKDIKEIFGDMKFDVVIGNPPYQLEDGGSGKSASPLYHKFIEVAKKLNPKYITMIIPARWYAGGKGLDSFRHEMLNDKRIRNLVDYQNSSEVFPNVDVAGGICYFLWARDKQGECNVKTIVDGKETELARKLNEFDVFIRDSRAVPIVRKILSKTKNTLENVVSVRKPFGLPTNYKPQEEGIPCWFIQRIGLKYAKKEDIDDSRGYLNKWKFLIPKSPIAGQTDFSKPVGFYHDVNTRIAKPWECCTESYLVAGAFGTEEEVLAFKSYIFTKTVRFLLLQAVITQDVTKKNFCFVPDLGKYTGRYTDNQLCEMWDITEEEWKLIDSRIRNIDLKKEDK